MRIVEIFFIIKLTFHIKKLMQCASPIGLVTGGFDGNATGANLPVYLSCKYIMRIK